MSKVVFDIETAGDFESLSEENKGYLLQYSEDENEKNETKKKVGLWPFTSEIVAIAILNPDTSKGKVYFQAPTAKIENFSEGGVDFVAASEKGILENFWQDIKNYYQFITFNGRGMDCPYLMLRSAILKIEPTKNLMPPRYSADFHVDLLDQLTFYGAFRKFNLDFYCQAFGIKSPKSGGMAGDKVTGYFKEGKFLEIAKYCLADVKATAELYKKWAEYIEN